MNGDSGRRPISPRNPTVWHWEPSIFRFADQSKKILAVIAARGGSKRLPGKNLLPLMGKSLLSHTIKEALDASSVDKLICSTDCEAIASEAELCGCEVPFIRPPSLSTDVASSVDVLIHSVRQFPDYDYVVLLQPTSPCRTSCDIDNAFDLLAREQADSCISLCRGGKPGLPRYSITTRFRVVEAITSDEQALNGPVIYRPNGALYLTSTDRLLETKELIGGAIAGYVMGDDQSIDIDTQADFDAAEAVLKARAAKL